MAATDASAGEPSNAGVFTLTRTGVTTRALTAYYTVSGDTRGGLDYSPLDGKVTFAIGQSNATVQIQPVDDSIYEGTESVILQLLPALAYKNSTNDTATVTIADDETQPIKVKAWPDEIVEGGSTNGQYIFMREGDTRSALTVFFALSGTATNGVDYQTLTNRVVFAAGISETNLNVSPINNTNYSGTRLAQLMIQTNAAYHALTNVDVATITIRDDEVPTVQILADDADAREASTVRDGRFRFLRNSSVNEALTVTFSVHGTATPDSDYDALPPTVTIPAGTNSVTLTVHPIDDSTNEFRETVIAVLQGSQDYRIGTTNTATVFIDDNDTISYEWEVLKATAIGESDINMPAELVLRRRGSTLTNAQFRLIFADGGSPTYPTESCMSGDVSNNAAPFLPAENLRYWMVFSNRNTEAHLYINRVNQYGIISGFPSALNLTVTNLFGTDSKQLNFLGRDRLIRTRFLTNQIVEGGTNTILRLSRSVPVTGQPPVPNFDLTFQLDGGAAIDTDYTLTNHTGNNVTVTFLGSLRTMDISIKATNDLINEGYESVYARLDLLANNYRPDTRPGSNWVSALNIKDSGTTGLATPLDSDGDGMSDDFEKLYGLDPFVFTDPYADSDGDGMPNLEEAADGTNPLSRDSDGDGIDDYQEWTHGSDAMNAASNTLSAAINYVPVRLSVASCFKCHQTTMSVGQYKLTSVPPIRGHTPDDTTRSQVFQFLKGQSYPIQVGGPVTADTNAFYTAQIFSVTNPAGFFIIDTNGMLGVGRPVSNLTTKVATLVVPKVELTWTNKGDNLALDNYTNANGQVMGKRIFVGAKTPTETTPRDTVMLKIKVTPPMPGSNVWLKAFDVDDTTDETFDRDDYGHAVIDFNGRSGDDNYGDYFIASKAGRFKVNGQYTYSTNLDANSEVLVEFQIGLQPGNNYRVAASVFPDNSLASLQPTNLSSMGFVSAYTDDISGGFNGALSPLLTVWRKLHLEFDSMEAPPTTGPDANSKNGYVLFVKTNYPNAGQSTIMVAVSPSQWQNNELENGTVELSGITNLFKIKGNHAETVTHIIVQGIAPSSAKDSICVIKDDDDRFLAQLGLPPALPKDGESTNIIEDIRDVFSRAFIEVVNANAEGFNPNKEIPFVLNTEMGALTGAGVFDDAKNLTDSQNFWAHTVTFGYQAAASEDRDPNSEDELIGITLKKSFLFNGGVSAIFIETIRDDAIDDFAQNQINNTNMYSTVRAAYWGNVWGTIAHEIGHAPGGNSANTDHNEFGLMQTGGDSIQQMKFSPITIKRFRTATQWRQ